MDKLTSSINWHDIWAYVQLHATQYGLKILAALFVLVVGLWVAKSLRKTVDKVLRARHVDDTVRLFFRQIVFVLLLIIVVVMALSNVGIQTASIIAVLATASFAVVMALQGSLSHLASGIILIVLRPFKVGDFVEIAGATGVVESIEVMFTQMHTTDNKVIVIPNNRILSSNITNYSVKDQRRADMVFGIGYDDDIAKAKSIITDILAQDERVLTKPVGPADPMIVVKELADSSVNILVRFWAASGDLWSAQYALWERVKIAFDEAGITIPFPQRDVHVISGDKV